MILKIELLITQKIEELFEKMKMILLIDSEL